MSRIFKLLMTGADNETPAIGRGLGMIVFVVFVIFLPLAGIAAVEARKLSARDLADILASLEVYVPAIIFAVAGLIGLTAPSEPKPRPPADNG